MDKAIKALYREKIFPRWKWESENIELVKAGNAIQSMLRMIAKSLKEKRNDAECLTCSSNRVSCNSCRDFSCKYRKQN